MKPLKTMLLHALLSAMLPIIICGCSNTPSTATLLLDCDPDTRNFGYIDSAGNVVIPYRFTTAFEFEGPHAIVIEKGDITVIDKNGDHVLDRLTSIGDFVNGFAVVRSRDNEIALVNRQYEVVVPFKKYARLTTPNDGLCKAWVETDHYFGKGYDVFVDTLGNERFRCNYFQVNEFSDSMLRVGTGRKQGFLDLEGNETIPPRYSDADDFHEGLAAVEFEGTELWGVIDKTGKTVVGPTYKKLLPYSEGLAAASVDGYHNFGYIDRQGKWSSSLNTLTPMNSRMAWLSSESACPGCYGTIMV